MARKKVALEEEIVNAVGEETALGSVPADTAPPDEAGADTGDFPAELPEGDFPAEETAEQSETLPAMESAEAKPFGLSAEEKTASQEENDTVEKRAEEAELHEETSEFLEAAEDLHSNLPASAPQGSEADEADWGFEEPVTEEAAAEPAEDEYLAADNAETLDASDEKSERTLFYELDFNELDRGLVKRSGRNGTLSMPLSAAAVPLPERSSAWISTQDTFRAVRQECLKTDGSSVPLWCRIASPF